MLLLTIFLLLAWILDGGLSRLKEIVKEPFVASMLILCAVIALGILWGDDPKLGFRSLAEIFCIPSFYSLLSPLE